MSFPVELPVKFIEKADSIDVKAADIVEQWIRGSGKGGQKVNKTASCVLLKHEPTGIIVKCQKHREQSKNRVSAYKLLILKIEDQVKGKKSEISQKIHKLRKQKQKRTKRAKEKMLDEKSKRSEIKSTRKRLD